VVKGEPLT